MKKVLVGVLDLDGDVMMVGDLVEYIFFEDLVLLGVVFVICLSCVGI